jgi:hypothetical protein
VSAIPVLDDEESYLAAILDDPSGIELAEFAWIDEEQDDGCFRVWDYQWTWYHDEETFQIDQAGRSLGKSVGITMRAFAFPFVFPGQEMLITAPELNHLRPLTDKVEALFLNVRLGRELLPRTKGAGINHQPQFQARFINGARIFSRLPNRDGKGVKGMHPLVLEADEMQDYPEAGWTELIETMKAGSEGAQWRCHGVSRGVRDTYYRMTTGENPDLPFKVHRFMAPHRPTWSDKERRSKIAIYGGTEDNVDYRRNIFGEHGDTHNPVFVLARLMACVRITESPWATEYNDRIYHCIKINDERHRKLGMPIEGFLHDIPGTHLSDEYSAYWAGMDVGYTNDPSEVLVFGVTKKGVLRLLLRVQMQRISSLDQALVITELFRVYGKKLRAFSMDKTGNGLPLWQAVKDQPMVKGRLKGYGFSEKRAVEFDDRPLARTEKPQDAVIEKNVVDYSTDELRKLVDTGLIELPYDLELLTEWQGQQVHLVKDMGSAGAVRRKYSDGGYHTLDAGRTMILGKSLEAMEALMDNTRRQGPVLDQFMG